MDILRTVFFTVWFFLWAGTLTYRICTKNWKEVLSYAKWAAACIALSLFLAIVKAPEWIYYVLLLGYLVLDHKMPKVAKNKGLGSELLEAGKR
jgi:hypothetical protein